MENAADAPKRKLRKNAAPWNPIFLSKAYVASHPGIVLEQYQLKEPRLKKYAEQVITLREDLRDKVRQLEAP